MRKTRLVFLAIALVILGKLTSNAQEKLNPKDTFTKIDNYLNSSVPNGYSGSVLVAKDGEILLSKGYGWANRNKKICNKPSTVFNIGSVTKQFTAAAILKLLELNQLSNSDKIEKYFQLASSDKKGNGT